MTAQDVFDKIYAATRTQKVRAVDGHGDCAFITVTGERCFIGMLLTEQQAHDAEAESWSHFRAANEIGYRGEQVVLLSLMGIHDELDPSTWDAHLTTLAAQHGAVYPPKEAVS